LRFSIITTALWSHGVHDCARGFPVFRWSVYNCTYIAWSPECGFRCRRLGSQARRSGDSLQKGILIPRLPGRVEEGLNPRPLQSWSKYPSVRAPTPPNYRPAIFVFHVLVRLYGTEEGTLWYVIGLYTRTSSFNQQKKNFFLPIIIGAIYNPVILQRLTFFLEAPPSLATTWYFPGDGARSCDKNKKRLTATVLITTRSESSPGFPTPEPNEGACLFLTLGLNRPC